MIGLSIVNIRSFTYVGAHTYQTTYLTFGGCLGIVLTTNSKPRTSSVGGVFQGGSPVPNRGAGLNSCPDRSHHLLWKWWKKKCQGLGGP